MSRFCSTLSEIMLSTPRGPWPWRASLPHERCCNFAEMAGHLDRSARGLYEGVVKKIRDEQARRIANQVAALPDSRLARGDAKPPLTGKMADALYGALVRPYIAGRRTVRNEITGGRPFMAFDPNQARVPAGEPGGGQWTGDGGGVGVADAPVQQVGKIVSNTTFPEDKPGKHEWRLNPIPRLPEDTDLAKVSAAYSKEVMAAYGKVETVDPNDLTTKQQKVNMVRVNEYVNYPGRTSNNRFEPTNSLPTVMRYGGKLTVLDGNHRASAAKIVGRPMRALVVDADAAMRDAGASPDHPDLYGALQRAARRRNVVTLAEGEGDEWGEPTDDEWSEFNSDTTTSQRAWIRRLAEGAVTTLSAAMLFRALQVGVNARQADLPEGEQRDRILAALIGPDGLSENVVRADLGALATRAFSNGRNDQIRKSAGDSPEDWSYYYSSMLDTSTCPSCRGKDGEEHEFDDPEFVTPNPDCEGEDFCRCITIMVRREGAMAASEPRILYDPDQPREPAGQPDGGQFASSGGGGTATQQPPVPMRQAGESDEEYRKRIVEYRRALIDAASGKAKPQFLGKPKGDITNADLLTAADRAEEIVDNVHDNVEPLESSADMYAFSVGRRELEAAMRQVRTKYIPGESADSKAMLSEKTLSAYRTIEMYEAMSAAHGDRAAILALGGASNWHTGDFVGYSAEWGAAAKAIGVDQDGYMTRRIFPNPEATKTDAMRLKYDNELSGAYATRTAYMQAKFAEDHGAEATVYRGVHGQFGTGPLYTGDDVDLDVRALSSWTPNPKHAENFANEGPEHGAVLETKVGAHDVWLYDNVGGQQGDYPEDAQEVVLLHGGGDIKAKVYSAYDPAEDGYEPPDDGYEDPAPIGADLP